MRIDARARRLDAICLGRAGVDLYAQEQGVAFTDVRGFDRYLGGSPANIAVGMARLGSRVGFVGVVSDDPLGDYVCETLQAEGVETCGIARTTDESRTSLAITEMRPDDCQVVIYRNRAADLALSAEMIDPQYVGQARLLVVSGTALSASPSREAVFAALLAAEEQKTSVLLDLDYRPYSWRSVAEASAVYRAAARFCQGVVGNLEEFAVLGAPVDESEAAIAAHVQRGVTETVFVKAGELGSHVFSPEGNFQQSIFPVETRKPFGAGDAYAAAVCAGLLAGVPLTESVRRGSAAAAIVVAGHACSDASPTTDELNAFLASRT